MFGAIRLETPADLVELNVGLLAETARRSTDCDTSDVGGLDAS